MLNKKKKIERILYLLENACKKKDKKYFLYLLEKYNSILLNCYKQNENQKKKINSLFFRILEK